MPLTRSLPETSGVFGSKLMNGYIPSSFHTGGGSLALLPITNKRFDSTQTIGISNRSIIFWRFMIPKPVTISGVSLAFTANTATTKTLTSITESSGTATATSTAHGFVAGDRIRISGATPSIYNGTKLVLTAATDTFTFAVTAGTGSASGTITAREFIGCGIYDSSTDDLFPRNKLADCAILPSTSNVITNLDANITLPSGIIWAGLGGSRISNNTSLATIVTGDESTSIVNTYLTGLKTANFAQFRGGCGIYTFDNESSPSTSDGNSGFKQTLTTGIPSSGVVRVGVDSNASAGSNWASKCPMVGLVVV